MDPVQIKSELIRADLTQSDIARVCGVTPQHVYRVIEGMNTSHPVQSVIAAAIGKPVEEIFPERYGPKKVPRRNEAKLRELARVNEQVRMAG